MSDLTKHDIEKVLIAHNYARAKTARVLGISPPTLLKLVKQHEINMQPSIHHHSFPKEYYLEALETCGWQLSKSAKYLNVSIQTLKKHMRRHQLGGFANG